MASVRIETLLALGEVHGGDSIAAPIVDPLRASFGDEDVVLVEQRAYLAEMLARGEPEVAARYAVADGVRLHVTDVVVPRPDLPRAIRGETPIAFHAAVIPVQPEPPKTESTEAWVIVLALAHTFYLNAGDDLDETIRREVLRIVAAREAPPSELLELLPPLNVELRRAEIDVVRGDEGPAGRVASLRRAVEKHERRKAAVLVLESVATPLHGAWEKVPFVGREREKRLVTQILRGEARLSLLLVGESGSGKTALLAAALRGSRDPTTLVYATSGAQLLAGMSGLGQWQERIRRVLEAAETLDAILYFDDLGDLFAERGSFGIDLASAMRPFLEDCRVRLVGEMHVSRVDFAERRNGPFFACLNRVRLEPADKAAALEAVRAHAARDASSDAPTATLTDRALEVIVDLAGRYFPYQSFPGKAVTLYRDLVSGRVAAAEQGAPREISEVDVFETMSLRTGVPSFLLREDRALLTADIERSLARRVLGQSEAVRAVAEALTVVKARLEPPGKPLATLLFVGPTGVGKTELARALAGYLFGSEARLVRIDMSEYMDPGAGVRLFRGSDSDGGVLTRAVREQPFGVVLLDEIEKAHASVFDVLLQIAGEGRLTDERGQTASFESALLVMTSNLGSEHAGAALGFAGRRDARGSYVRAVEQAFRPELVNRIDRIVPFASLGLAEAEGIVKLLVEQIRGRRGLTDLGVDVSVGEGVEARLVADGFNDTYGARALRRHVERSIGAPLARLLAAHAAEARSGRVVVRLVEAAEETGRHLDGYTPLAATSDGPFAFSLFRRTASSKARDLGGMNAITDARREMQGFLALHAVEALREKRAWLAAQLHADADSRRKNKRRGESAEIGKVAAEHHRVNVIIEALDHAYASIAELEGLAMIEFFDGGSIRALALEVEAPRRAIRRALARALVAEDDRRDHIYLLAHELDDGRALDLYVAPLLEHAASLGFRVAVHFAGDHANDWPIDRRFGPPRAPDVASARLTSKRQRSVVVQASGDFAGAFLALEGGLHRFSSARPDGGEARMFIERLARKPSLSDEDWTRPSVAPLDPANAEGLRRSPPMRSFDVGAARLTVVDRDVVLDMALEEYWPRFEEVVLEHLLLAEIDERVHRGDHLAEVLATIAGSAAEGEIAR